MLSQSYTLSSNFLKISCQPFIIKRFVRNPFKRGPKLLEGKVKTVTQYDTDEFCDVQDFQDLVRRVKTNEKFDEVAVEEAFTREDDFGTAVARTMEQKEINRQSTEHEFFVKKQIIKRKYFKHELETNLLTYAAKQQIRYLNKLNPAEWTPETLSRCFPITVTGVKKLLKSNYKLLTPEKIKAHDKEVEDRWELLRARKYSESITFYTQHMWDEGKILKDNFNGNPKLPNVPSETNKIIKEEKSTKTGEFSSIIQHYIKYKKEKEALDKTTCTSTELQVNIGAMNSLKNEESQSNKKNYVSYNEDEGTLDSFTSKSRKKQHNIIGDSELLHSQFKENLKEEMKFHEKKLDSEYVKWLKKQSVELNFPPTSTKPFNAKQAFTKIPKFDNDTVELKREKQKAGESFYMYDEKHGYQYPTGKRIKGKIRVPSKQQKQASVYRVGDCVYDVDGEFLYKIA
ncbi:uncharacterized protein LOC129980730 [Argiope bruennichi]|uniref:uncharacterized protein LOC129980730 n=1 Tax=Argiope bruennichi TaxID=94029 RepID=UPI00249435FD|nr:uncharacterized protein LOC129980730 [Argiope bruennichi]